MNYNSSTPLAIPIFFGMLATWRERLSLYETNIRNISFNLIKIHFFFNSVRIKFKENFILYSIIILV